MSPMTLGGLPPEILLMVLELLPGIAVRNFARTNRHYYELYLPYSYRELNLQAIRKRAFVKSRSENLDFCADSLMDALRFFLRRKDCACAVRSLEMVTWGPNDSLLEEFQSKQDLEALAHEVEHMCGSNKLNISFEPDLPALLRSGSTRSKEFLLLHILSDIEELVVGEAVENMASFDWRYLIAQRLMKCGSDISGYYQSLPRGLLNLSSYQIQTDYPDAVIRSGTIILPFTLPKIDSIKPYITTRVSMVGHPQRLLYTTDPSGDRILSVEDCFFSAHLLGLLALLCKPPITLSVTIAENLPRPRLDEASWPWFSDTDIKHKTFANAVVQPLAARLRVLEVFGNTGTWQSGGSDTKDPRYIGPLNKHLYLETVIVPWFCLREDSRAPDCISWEEMLPPKLGSLYVYGRQLRAEKDRSESELFRGLVDAKLANPRLRVNMICIFTGSLKVDFELIAIAQKAHIAVTYVVDRRDRFRCQGEAYT